MVVDDRAGLDHFDESFHSAVDNDWLDEQKSDSKLMQMKFQEL